MVEFLIELLLVARSRLKSRARLGAEILVLPANPARSYVCAQGFLTTQHRGRELAFLDESL
jgi:hypothetical protein